MADAEWDSVTRIGSKARSGGGGGVDRERVIRGKSAINAASRSGAIVGTEKKYGTANSKASVDGQRLAKLDRETDIVAPPTVGKKVGDAIRRRRDELKLAQKDLARLCNLKESDISILEKGDATPNNEHLSRLEKHLKVYLRGSGDNIGKEKTFGPKKK